MDQGKKSFVLYFDYREHLELLTDEERGRLLMALMDYGERGVLPELAGAARMAFSFIRAQLDRDNAKYARKCAKNAENGAKGGRPRKHDGFEENPKPTDETEGNPAEPNGLYENPTKPKETERFFEKPRKADTDTDTDTDTDIYIPPIPPEVSGRDVAKEVLTEARFNEFWAAYPKKVGKQYAFKAWKRIKPTAELHDRIMQALADQKRSTQWVRENGRFIPNPATWLNGGYWDNEEVTSDAADRPAPEQPENPGRNWTKGFKPADDDLE